MIGNDNAAIRQKLLDIVKVKGVAISRLANHLGVEAKNIFYEYMKGNLPEKGVADDGTKFFFHGLGCSIKDLKGAWEVEIEFGPHGTYTAFDKYTLCHQLGAAISDCDKFISGLKQAGLIKACDDCGADDLTDDEKEIDAAVADRLIFID